MRTYSLGIPEPCEKIALDACQADTKTEEKVLFEGELEQEIQSPYQDPE